MALECPRCHKPYLRRSQPIDAPERLLSWGLVAAFRCQICMHRFLAPRWRQDAQQAGGSAFDERREYERLATNLAATFTANRTRGEGLIATISMDGCSLETDSPLQVGDTLRLQVQLPQIVQPMDIESAIVRTVASTTLGLQFQRLSATAREQLGQFILRLFEDLKSEN